MWHRLLLPSCGRPLKWQRVHFATSEVNSCNQTLTVSYAFPISVHQFESLGWTSPPEDADGSSMRKRRVTKRQLSVQRLLAFLGTLAPLRARWKGWTLSPKRCTYVRSYFRGCTSSFKNPQTYNKPNEVWVYTKDQVGERGLCKGFLDFL